MVTTSTEYRIISYPPRREGQPHEYGVANCHFNGQGELTKIGHPLILATSVQSLQEKLDQVTEAFSLAHLEASPYQA